MPSPTSRGGEAAFSPGHLRAPAWGLGSRPRDSAPRRGSRATREASAQRALSPGRVRGQQGRGRSGGQVPGDPKPDDGEPRRRAVTCRLGRGRRDGGSRGDGGTGFAAPELSLGRRGLGTVPRGRVLSTAPLCGVRKGPGWVPEGREEDTRGERGPPGLCPALGSRGHASTHGPCCCGGRTVEGDAGGGVPTFFAPCISRSRKNPPRWSGRGRRGYAWTRVPKCVDTVKYVCLNMHSCVAWVHVCVAMRLCACVYLSMCTWACACEYTCACASVSGHVSVCGCE